MAPPPPDMGTGATKSPDSTWRGAESRTTSDEMIATPPRPKDTPDAICESVSFGGGVHDGGGFAVDSYFSKNTVPRPTPAMPAPSSASPAHRRPAPVSDGSAGAGDCEGGEGAAGGGAAGADDSPPGAASAGLRDVGAGCGGAAVAPVAPAGWPSSMRTASPRTPASTWAAYVRGGWPRCLTVT